jgi:hypothetical protein
MYRVKIYDLEGKHTHGLHQVETLEEAQAWLDQETSAARPFGRYYNAFWSTEYLEGAETREVESGIEDEVITEYLHPATYTYEILDLTNDYDYLLQQCHEKRKSEYPDIADYMDGLVKGDQAQMDKYIADCLAVKAKYPKPVAE